MTRYSVNAMIEFPAWLSVEADSEAEAEELAAAASPSEFEYDKQRLSVVRRVAEGRG